MLRQHPDIWMPPLKEIHYFDHLYVPENRSWTLPHIKKGVAEALKWHIQKDAIRLDHFKYLVDLAMVNPFTEEWYRACFNRPAAKGKVTGDITPEYCTLPEEGISYVRQLLGEKLKIVYIIRHPVERAISQLKMNLTRMGKENENEAFWLAAAKERVITQRGDYQTYIPRWEKAFPRESILYLPYKQVNSTPLSFLKQIETHLGIPHYPQYSGIGNRVHKTGEAKVPASVIAYLEEALAPQSTFLKSHLGQEFYGAI